MDRDAGRSLTAFVSSDKRLAMWQIIAEEKDRVADLPREFPGEFRVIARPQMAWNPFIGHHLCCKVKVEGGDGNSAGKSIFGWRSFGYIILAFFAALW